MRPLPAMLAILIGVALASCGKGGDAPSAPDAGRSPAAAPQPTLLTCPVEGTRFRKGTGATARAGDARVEVCSEGCRYRFELEPELYPRAGNGR